MHLGANTLASVLRTVAALVAVSVLTLAAACGRSQPVEEPGDGPAIGAVPTERAGGSGLPLPVLSLEYQGEAIEGSRGISCWAVDDQPHRKCLEPAPWRGVDTHTEIAPGEPLTVRIESDARPKGLFALVVTEPGEVHVDFKRLSTVLRVFELDQGPGDYKVRVTAQWEQGNVDVSYEFGLRLPGASVLTGQCESTLIGGERGLILDSLDDPLRTAADAVNSAGCRFNQPIVHVRLMLDGVAVQPYTETFYLDPPSPKVPFPLTDGIVSESTGGPLPPGEYSRRIVAIAADGQEWNLTTDGRPFLDSVTLAEP